MLCKIWPWIKSSNGIQTYQTALTVTPLSASAKNKVVIDKFMSIATKPWPYLTTKKTHQGPALYSKRLLQISPLSNMAQMSPEIINTAYGEISLTIVYKTFWIAFAFD